MAETIPINTIKVIAFLAIIGSLVSLFLPFIGKIILSLIIVVAALCLLAKPERVDNIVRLYTQHKRILIGLLILIFVVFLILINWYVYVYKISVFGY